MPPLILVYTKMTIILQLHYILALREIQFICICSLKELKVKKNLANSLKSPQLSSPYIRRNETYSYWNLKTIKANATESD